MKKLIIALFFVPCYLLAQVPQADELIGVHNVTTTEMNAIASPVEGNLAYNTTDSTLYFYDGSIWVALGAVGLYPVETKTNNYTLTASDHNKTIEFDTTADVTCTVPAGLPTGFQVSITQLGTGRVEFVGGATLRNAYNAFKTARQYSKAGVEVASTGEVIISGDVAK